MDAKEQFAGDHIPSPCEVIEVRVSDLNQLFKALDPSPFRERDLDIDAEEFIVDWAKDVPRDARLALLVHLDRPSGGEDEIRLLRDGVREFFKHRAERTRKRLKRLFQVGRVSLLIGITLLVAAFIASRFVAAVKPALPFGDLLRESLLIGGWVAMWRPMEIFLYDWWPIRTEAKLYDRLSEMPVRIAYAAQGARAS